ncbi:transcriptional activator FtrB [compost metagenome]
MPLLASNANLAFSFLKSVSEQLQQADELAGALHIFEAEKRLARLLLHLYSRQSLSSGGEEEYPMLHLPAAKKEFAAMIGTTPETLSRKLNQLESLGLIRVNNRTVMILDILALSKIAEITE